MILPELVKLTQRGWWTVGSQPTINGVSSSDQVVGWGPKAGYVFQKGFVEFFCEEADVEVLERKVEERGRGWVHYIAGNHKVSSIDSDLWNGGVDVTFQGELRTNVPDYGRNAVTWGVFPGQEIIQTTIIEQESFLSWKVSFTPHRHLRQTLSRPVGRSFLHLVRLGIMLPPRFGRA